VKVWRQRCIATDQSLTVASEEPDKTCFPSLDMIKERTLSACPTSLAAVAEGLPSPDPVFGARGSYILMTLSGVPQASKEPLGFVASA